MGTTTDKLFSNTSSGNTPAITVNKIKDILSSYEAVWDNKAEMKNLYASRVNNVEMLYIKGSHRNGTHTNEDTNYIYVVANPVTDGSNNWAEDEIFHGMAKNGEMGFAHNIVAAILMEIGNCGKTKGVTEGIRSRLYQGVITLKAAGYEIALHESAGMWGYIRMMREIPAELRPHQSNRDIEGSKACSTSETFGRYFADSKHSTQDTGGSTTLLSWETYAFESISLASRDDVKKLLHALGGILLGVRGGIKWPDVVQQLNKKFGADKAHNTSFYGATIELIKGYQNLHNMFSPWHDPWELTEGMETLFVPKSVTVNKNEYLSMCQSITAGIPGVPKQMSPTKDIISITSTNKYLKVTQF